MRSPPLTVSMPVSKATSWAGQAARPLRGSSRSLGVLSFHGLICPASSIRRAQDAAGRSPQNTHWPPQLASTCGGEDVLADPGGGQHDPLGLQHRPRCGTAITGELVAQGRFQHGDIELVLAEQGQLPSVLQSQEVRQPPRSDAFAAGGLQQHPVHPAEPGRVIAQHGPGQGIPPRAMRPGPVQVRPSWPVRWTAAGRTTGPATAPAQAPDARSAAEVPVIDQERRGQAQQRLGRQERHLPAAAGRTAPGQRPELLPCLADRQVQVISQVSHVGRLQPAQAA